MGRASSRGRSGGAPITIFPLRDAPVRFACEVKDFEPTVAMDRKLARRTDRYCQFVLVAAREAIEDSGLDVTAEGLGERTGTAVATGIGGLQTLDLAHEHLFAKGIDRMSPLWITMLIPNMGAAMVSMEYGFRGPVEHASPPPARPRRWRSATPSASSATAAPT